MATQGGLTWLAARSSALAPATSRADPRAALCAPSRPAGAGEQWTPNSVNRQTLWVLGVGLGTLSPLGGSGLAGGVGLHDIGQLVDDQLQDLDQQWDVGPALRVWEEGEAARQACGLPGDASPRPHPPRRTAQ